MWFSFPLVISYTLLLSIFIGLKRYHKTLKNKLVGDISSKVFVWFDKWGRKKNIFWDDTRKLLTNYALLNHCVKYAKIRVFSIASHEYTMNRLRISRNHFLKWNIARPTVGPFLILTSLFTSLNCVFCVRVRL